MFLFRKISCHVKERKMIYLFLITFVFIGFLCGCFYTNLVSEAEFSDAGVQAEEFIKGAKENELSFRLMLSEELSSYLLIALFSLFLPGFLPTIFLVFKRGFSTGFFLTFLVKYFSAKGFLLSGMFLLCNLLFFLPALLMLTNQSLSVNRFLITSALHKFAAKQTLFSELLGMTITTVGSILSVTVGVSLKFLLLSPLCHYLFL